MSFYSHNRKRQATAPGPQKDLKRMAQFYNFNSQTSYMEQTMQNRPDAKLEDLFLDELKEIYGAELHQLQVLPLLKKAASSLKLQNVLASHLDDTREQISRLKTIFEKMGQTAETRISEAILGITQIGRAHV